MLALFVFQTTGQFILFQVMQQHYRRQAVRQLSRSLPDDALTVLRFSKNQHSSFRLVDDGRELHFRGHWYDIVRTESRGDTLIFFTLPDEQETRLLARWSQQLKSGEQMPSAQHQLHDYFQQISLLKYLVPSLPYTLSALALILPAPAQVLQVPDAPQKQPPTPPPQMTTGKPLLS